MELANIIVKHAGDINARYLDLLIETVKKLDIEDTDLLKVQTFTMGVIEQAYRDGYQQAVTDASTKLFKITQNEQTEN